MQCRRKRGRIDSGDFEGVFAMFLLSTSHWVFVFVIFLLPATLVAFSPKVRGYEKLGWSLFSFVLSWLGFVIFLMVSSNRPNASHPG
jgi:hypothetical protein